jgi:hypothetical protein
MKTIVAAFAIAFALISTSASAAFNGHDWADILSSILRPAPVVVVQPVSVFCGSGTIPNGQGGCELVPVYVGPASTMRPTEPIACGGSTTRNVNGSCVVVTPNGNGGVTQPTDAKAAQDAYLAQPSAPLGTPEVAADCTPVVVDNTDGRVCIKLDSGAVACGKYLGPQQ